MTIAAIVRQPASTPTLDFVISGTLRIGSPLLSMLSAATAEADPRGPLPTG